VFDGGYNVMYSDGRVEEKDKPPPETVDVESNSVEQVVSEVAESMNVKEEESKEVTNKEGREGKSDKVLERIITEMWKWDPLPIIHRGDFQYTGRQFKEEVRKVLKSEYKTLQPIRRLYDLLSSFLCIKTPQVKWDFRRKGEYLGRCRRKDGVILLRKPATLKVVLHEFFHYVDSYNRALEIVVWLFLVGLFTVPNEVLERNTFKEMLCTIRETLKKAKQELIIRKLEASTEMFAKEK